MKIFSIEVLLFIVVLVNALSAKSLYVKRSDAENEASPSGEELAFDDEKAITEEISDANSDPIQDDSEIAKSSDEKQEIKSELLTEVDNDETNQKQNNQEDTNNQEKTTEDESSINLEKETDKENTDPVDSNDKVDDANDGQISKEENTLDDDLKTTETTSAELENDAKSETNDKVEESKDDSKVEASNLSEKVTSDEKSEEKDENKSESTERSDSSNKPHSIKESSGKQSVAGETEEKTNSSAWFNINPFYLIIPIVILALLAVALAVFALYKKNIIFIKKTNRNDSLPKSGAVYSPVTQTENK